MNYFNVLKIKSLIAFSWFRWFIPQINAPEEKKIPIFDFLIQFQISAHTLSVDISCKHLICKNLPFKGHELKWPQATYINNPVNIAKCLFAIQIKSFLHINKCSMFFTERILYRMIEQSCFSKSLLFHFHFGSKINSIRTKIPSTQNWVIFIKNWGTLNEAVNFNQYR